MNAITGLPRSGSTLLCNVLNQNPEFFVSSTSNLAGVINGISTYFSSQLEFKYHLDKNREKETERLRKSIQSFCKEWYKPEGKKTVFDKSREWLINVDILNAIGGKSICIVRDPRNIVASIEKQNRETGLFHEARLTYGQKLDGLFDPEKGLIGTPLTALKSIIDRNYDASILLTIDDLENKIKKVKKQPLLIIKYETFAKHPEAVLKVIYSFIGKKIFDHNLENVENVAEDCDGLYLYKYPHQGKGKIIETNPFEYKKYMSREIHIGIEQKYKWFFQLFNYEVTNLKN